MRTSPCLLLGAAALLAAPVLAQLPPPVDPDLRARFGFVGPRIHKIGWGISMLRVARLDANAPATALIDNGRRARLELLRVDGDALTAETVSTDGEIHGLAVGDANGDGTPDLMMLSGRGRLLARALGRDEPELPPVEVGVAGMHDALRAGDLDGDGAADALVLTRDGLRWVTSIGAEPRVSPADPVPSRVRAMHLHDVDGDGHLDVMLVLHEAPMPLRIRRGRGDGTFGPWIAFDVRGLGTAFPGTGVGGRPTIATIEGDHGRVVEYALHESEEPRRPSFRLTTLQESRANDRPFAHGDVDGDGDADLVLADPERARLSILLEQDGELVVRTVPSLSGIDSLSLAELDGDGRLDLLLCSSEERALAWKSGAAPLDAFPERLPSAEQPMVAAVHDGSVLFLARDERRNASLYRLARGPDGAFGDPEKLPLELGRHDPPRRMWVADLDGQAGPEVVYVQPGEGLRVLFATADGGYERASEERDAAVMKVDDGAVSMGEYDGRPALFVVRPRYTRVLRFDADREPLVLFQDNGPEGIGEISLGIRLGGGARAYADNAAGKVWLTEPGRAARTVDIPKVGATHMLEHERSIVLLSKTAVVRIPFGEGGWEIERLRAHEPPTEKTSYYGGIAADLDGDATKELVVADNRIHGFHVLVAEADALRTGLAFPVFEQPEAAAANFEPRGYEAGDMNGDGRTDLAVLCHDRVLVYLQEE